MSTFAILEWSTFQMPLLLKISGLSKMPQHCTASGCKNQRFKFPKNWKKNTSVSWFVFLYKHNYFHTQNYPICWSLLQGKFSLLNLSLLSMTWTILGLSQKAPSWSTVSNAAQNQYLSEYRLLSLWAVSLCCDAIGNQIENCQSIHSSLGICSVALKTTFSMIFPMKGRFEIWSIVA